MGMGAGFETPPVSVQAFRPVATDSGGGLPSFEIALHVINPNLEPLELVGISYTISLDGHELIKGVGNELPVIEGYGEGSFTLTASVVELSNGQVGLVIEQNRRHALRPKEMILRDAERGRLPRPQIVELADLPLDAAQPKAVWIAQGHEHGAFEIDPRDYFVPRQP